MAFVCTVIVTKAQVVTDFRLGEYKYRTSGYRALLIDGNLGSSAGGGKSLGNNRTDFLLNGDSKVDYISVFSTDHKQHLSSLSGYLRIDGIGQKLAGNKVSGQSLRTFADYRYLDRHYLKQFFVEYGGSAGVSYDYSKGKTRDSLFSSNGYSMGVRPSFGIGRGRLEPVGDAQTAIFILEALYEKGKIPKVEAEVARQFARLITDFRNKRLFDLRRRSISQIMQIDSFFRHHQLIRQTDAETVALTYDNLYFAFNNDLSFLPGFFQSHESQQYSFDDIGGYIPNKADQVYTSDNGFDIYARDYSRFIDEFAVQTLQSINEQTPRLSGRVMYVRLSGAAFIQKDLAEQIKKNILDKRVTIGYEHHIPMNLKWQKSYMARIAFRSTNDYSIDPFFYPNSTMYWMTGKYQLGFYPNNRSSIEGQSVLDLTRTRINSSSTAVQEGKYLSGSFSARVIGTYFLNFHTVVKGSVSTGYNKILSSPGSKDGYFSIGFALRLLHYFY